MHDEVLEEESKWWLNGTTDPCEGMKRKKVEKREDIFLKIFFSKGWLF